MAPFINGIQQVGLGVKNAREAFNWYRRALGFDILVFEDESAARLMTPYTGGVAVERYALLALNMLGGGGLEFWQPRGRSARPPKHSLLLGDLGINMIKLRSKNLERAYHILQNSPGSWVGDHPLSDGKPFFYAADPWGNYLQIIADDYVFSRVSSVTGGVMGTVIGVSDMETAISFYQKLLGYDKLISDQRGRFDEFSQLPGGEGEFRRVVLRHSSRRVGGFGELLGPSSVELIQALDRHPRLIYDGRHWGDLGYMHLCYDVQGMGSLKNHCRKLGHAFTVDSDDGFQMGKAAGRFGYIEDPDATMIEFVETYRVPLLKRFNLHINLTHQKPGKPLPKWLVSLLRFHRIYRDL